MPYIPPSLHFEGDMSESNLKDFVNSLQQNWSALSLNERKSMVYKKITQGIHWDIPRPTIIRELRNALQRCEVGDYYHVGFFDLVYAQCLERIQNPRK